MKRAGGSVDPVAYRVEAIGQFLWPPMGVWEFVSDIPDGVLEEKWIRWIGRILGDAGV